MSILSITLSYQFIPNLIAIVSILGIVFIILRRLPEAADISSQEPLGPSAEIKLVMKGLPAIAVSRLRAFLKIVWNKLWNFALEAKDLKPSAATGYKIKKIIGNRFHAIKPLSAPASTDEVKNERYYLNIIKKNPKNLDNYDALGKFYLDQNNIQDASDIYEYLTGHDGANPDYHARLAYCYYQLKKFDQTIEHYRKSLALDSSQPNRYYNLGLVLESQGQFAEAAESITKAIALEPENSKYYLSICNAYLKLGQNDQALHALQKAHELNPEDQNIAQKIDRVKSAVPVKHI